MVTRRLVKRINRHGTCPGENYRIFETPEDLRVYQSCIDSRKPFLINLEDDTDFDIFPSRQKSLELKAMYLVRDPVRCYDSWRNLKWEGLNAYVRYGWKLQRMWRYGYGVDFLLYEKLVKNPEQEIKRVCDVWNVPFEEGMLKFSRNLEDEITLLPAQGVWNRRPNLPNLPKEAFEAEDKEGLFETVKTYNSVVEFKSHGCLNAEEIEKIECGLGRGYLKLWGESYTRIHEALAAKTWFFFDLDDTLYGFSRAAGMAIDAVFMKIYAEPEASELETIRDAYRNVLNDKAASEFSDARVSREVRKEWFTALAQVVMSYNDAYVDELANIYEKAFKGALMLKYGALHLLRALKTAGKKIAIITEGSDVLQQWVLRQLGLTEYVDFVATADKFRTSRKEGLLGMVILDIDVESEDVVYIGNRLLRDVKSEGVYAVRYDERANIDLDAALVKVNTLWKVLFLFDGSARLP